MREKEAHFLIGGPIKKYFLGSERENHPVMQQLEALDMRAEAPAIQENLDVAGQRRRLPSRSRENISCSVFQVFRTRNAFLALPASPPPCFLDRTPRPKAATAASAIWAAFWQPDVWNR